MDHSISNLKDSLNIHPPFSSAGRTLRASSPSTKNRYDSTSVSVSGAEGHQSWVTGSWCEVSSLVVYGSVYPVLSSLR